MSQYFHNYWDVNFLGRNKIIIKYETVTNHNWKKMFCENVVTLGCWMWKIYSTFSLFNMYCSSLFILFYFYFFLVIDLCSFFLYIKRVNRLMNSVINNIFGLVTCLFLPFFFSLQVHQLGLASFFSFKWSLYVYFLLVM